MVPPESTEQLLRAEIVSPDLKFRHIEPKSVSSNDLTKVWISASESLAVFDDLMEFVGASGLTSFVSGSLSGEGRSSTRPSLITVLRNSLMVRIECIAASIWFGSGSIRAAIRHRVSPPPGVGADSCVWSLHEDRLNWLSIKSDAAPSLLSAELVCPPAEVGDSGIFGCSTFDTH